MLSVTRYFLPALCLFAVAAGAFAADEAKQGQQVYDFEFEAPGTEAPPDLFDQGIFNRRVTLDFKNADIQNVIRLVAARSGLNILLDPSEVEGRITLSLDNVPLGDALDNILKVNKLAYIIETGGIVRIVPESRVGREQVETRTEIIELNWRDSKDIEETFRGFLTTHGDMKANEEAQAIIITDVPPNIIRIKELIRQIDRPDRQVSIYARLVDIEQAAGRTLTTEWAASKVNKARSFAVDGTVPDIDGLLKTGLVSGSDASLFAPIGGVSAVALEGFGVKGGLGTLSFGSVIGVLGDEYLIDATLTALEQRDVVEVLANPRVTTLNNVPALIRIIERIPYIEAVQGTQGVIVGEVEFEEAGVIIQVKPIITPNEYVRLDIELEQRILRRRVAAGSIDARTEAFNPPQIDVRNAQTTVIVKDGNTVVLGGLRELRKNEGVKGVPWMNRIPVIGWMFKDKNNAYEKKELLLMVTPDVVKEALLTDQEKELYDMIDADWHLPDYFLDDVHHEATK